MAERGPHRREQRGGIRGDQHHQDARGRFLDGLEQGVLTLFVDRVGFDEIDLPGGELRRHVDIGAHLAPDPLDPNIMYGGKVTRFDYRTGQTQNVAPKPFRDANYRMLRTAPILFSPVNPRKLYFGANTIWQTLDGGNRWTEISPDLTRRDSVVPPNVGKYAAETTARVAVGLPNASAMAA